MSGVTAAVRGPKAAEACAEPTAIDGDLGRPGDSDTLCPLSCAPVSASAHGRWNGRRTDHERTYGNACEPRAATGDVFALEG
ncbi:SSI family serine proteinase inhibitor [Streptomyces griseoluteus]|uniref:SSI family serine proteinase inhibitor n=1 Tax=Streptomyces griseoluteus TaxID=29306 RepID=UPI002446FA36|nr:SSI family serine proteinase inhibitor [Streptomyces griseoluteus]